jgi:hypothetical protein
MTKKKDIILVNHLKYIKKRRMQKYHARKIMRFFRQYGVDPLWINSFVKVRKYCIKNKL